MTRFDTLIQRDLPTILGVGILSGATIAWLLGRIPIADWSIVAGVAGPWIVMRQRAPVPSSVPTPTLPIPATPAADHQPLSGATPRTTP